MADHRIAPAPAIPFTGERGPRASMADLEGADDILGSGTSPVYVVKASQWGHDQDHWKRDELFREDQLGKGYDLDWALANGTVARAEPDVSSRFGVRRSKKDLVDPHLAAKLGDPDDEGAHPPIKHPDRNADGTPRAIRRVDDDDEDEEPHEAAKRTDPDDEGAKPKLDPDDARVSQEEGRGVAGGAPAAVVAHTEVARTEPAKPGPQGSQGHTQQRK